jgi:putative redox protein
MVEAEITYEGDLRCQARHGPSGTILCTDAPLDNEGRGESFSPTDLAATALGTCMLTIMGIVARRHEIDLGATSVKVRKFMTSQPPRRIARLEVDFQVDLPPDHPKRSLLENAARQCPVHLSLHPDIEQAVQFFWQQSTPSSL